MVISTCATQLQKCAAASSYDTAVGAALDMLFACIVRTWEEALCSCREVTLVKKSTLRSYRLCGSYYY